MTWTSGRHPSNLGSKAEAPVFGAQTGGGTGGGRLPVTGSDTGALLRLAGFAFVLGGLLVAITPTRRAMLRMVGLAPPASRGAAWEDWQVLGWSAPFDKNDKPGGTKT